MGKFYKILGIFVVIGLIGVLFNNSWAQTIEIKKNSESGYTLLVDNKPFLVKGVGYNPIPIGKGYDYNFFADPNKPWLVDGKLMKKAGINVVRIYTTYEEIEKVREFIKEMYENFGIYTLVSDWLGLWDYPRANYTDAAFKDRTKQRVLRIVQALKDEKGLLMWILGNENNYTFTGRIGFWTSEEIENIGDPRLKQEKRAEIYYSFVDDLAKEIKEVDPLHPVVLGNGEANFLGIAAKVAKNVDALGIIIYRGKRFGNLFNNIKNTFDKPVLLSEFGCDSYNAYKKEEDQEAQAEFILAQWEDLIKNTTFGESAAGNAIGGCLFEWNDEWWKHNEGYANDWTIHNKEAGWSHGAYYYDIRAKENMNMNEEWFGVVSLGEEIENGINKRIPKKSYYALSEFLNKLK